MPRQQEQSGSVNHDVSNNLCFK